LTRGRVSVIGSLLIGAAQAAVGIVQASGAGT